MIYIIFIFTKALSESLYPVKWSVDILEQDKSTQNMSAMCLHSTWKNMMPSWDLALVAKGKKFSQKQSCFYDWPSMSGLSLYQVLFVDWPLLQSWDSTRISLHTLCPWCTWWWLTDANLQWWNLAHWCSGVQNYAEALWCARLESLFRWRALSASGQLWLCGTKPPEQRFISLHIFTASGGANNELEQSLTNAHSTEQTTGQVAESCVTDTCKWNATWLFLHFINFLHCDYRRDFCWLKRTHSYLMFILLKTSEQHLVSLGLIRQSFRKDVHKYSSMVAQSLVLSCHSKKGPGIKP